MQAYFFLTDKEVEAWSVGIKKREVGKIIRTLAEEHECTVVTIRALIPGPADILLLVDAPDDRRLTAFGIELERNPLVNSITVYVESGVDLESDRAAIPN